MKKSYINGYTVQFNDYSKTWQVWHDEMGFIGEYRRFEDAELDCIKG